MTATRDYLAIALFLLLLASCTRDAGNLDSRNSDLGFSRFSHLAIDLHNQEVSCIGFVNDSTLAIGRTDSKEFALLELPSGSKLSTVSAIHSSGRILFNRNLCQAVVDNLEFVAIVDYDTGELIQKMKAHSPRLICNGQVLVACRQFEAPIFWHLGSRQKIEIFESRKDITEQEMATDAKGFWGVVRVGPKHEGRYEVILSSDEHHNVDLHAFPNRWPSTIVDGKKVVARNIKKKVGFVEVGSKKTLGTVSYTGVRDYAFSTDERFAIASVESGETIVRVFSIPGGVETMRFGPFEGEPTSVCWNSNNDSIGVALRLDINQSRVLVIPLNK